MDIKKGTGAIRFLFYGFGLFAEEALDLVEQAFAFLYDIADIAAELFGNALDDGVQLILIQIDAEKFLDGAERILGELGDQILVAGQLRDEFGDNFLDIHEKAPFKNITGYHQSDLYCKYYTKIETTWQ